MAKAVLKEETPGVGKPFRFGQVCGRPINLPGECWAEIQQLALIGSSSSLRSEACSALGASDGVVHSSISLKAACSRAAANRRRSPPVAKAQAIAARCAATALRGGSPGKQLARKYWKSGIPRACTETPAATLPRGPPSRPT